MITEEKTVEREHVWESPPVVRGLMTLLGVAVAGFLIWLASEFDLGSTGEYWAAMGILAGAGVCLGLSQLLGGWTKWGAPTISSGVLLLAFVPAFVAVGGILVATRPTDSEEGEQVAGWIGDIGLGGLAEDLIAFQGVLAFGLGVLFAFCFDTRGPRARVLEQETAVTAEGVGYERGAVAAPRTRRSSRPRVLIAPELVFAAEANEEEDEHGGDQAEEERASAAGADREQPDPDVSAEEDPQASAWNPGLKAGGRGGNSIAAESNRLGSRVSGTKKTRRAGFAFVHHSDRLSASAYAARWGFDLLALRARRKRESRRPWGTVQGVRKLYPANCGKFSFPQFPHPKTRTCGHLCGTRLGDRTGERGRRVLAGRRSRGGSRRSPGPRRLDLAWTSSSV